MAHAVVAILVQEQAVGQENHNVPRKLEYSAHKP
jgi:hypothetical protein